jgi:hypothetical protein
MLTLLRGRIERITQERTSGRPRNTFPLPTGSNRRIQISPARKRALAAVRGKPTPAAGGGLGEKQVAPDGSALAVNSSKNRENRGVATGNLRIAQGEGAAGKGVRTHASSAREREKARASMSKIRICIEKSAGGKAFTAILGLRDVPNHIQAASLLRAQHSLCEAVTRRC